ncbi:MAG: hypothetical protein WCL29_02745 [Pseudomonadota bacterium]
MTNEQPDSGANQAMPVTEAKKATQSAESAVSFAPGLLADLTRALLPFLGPYSITTVKRAARGSDSTNDLLRNIASHIDDIAKREMYLKSSRRIVKDYNDALANSTVAQAPHVAEANTPAEEDDGNRASAPVTAELAQRGEAALAPIIGPLASVLVSRYAKVSQNSREFFERLAGHLRTPEERDSFFLSVRTGNGTWRSL